MNKKPSVPLLLAFLGLILAVPLVIFIFKLDFEKKYLSLFASALFLGVTIISLMIGRQQQVSRLTSLAHLLFILFFALPIIGLRLAYWNLNFDDAEVRLIFHASTYHKYSSWMFSVLILSMGYELVQSLRRSK